MHTQPRRVLALAAALAALTVSAPLLARDDDKHAAEKLAKLLGDRVAGKPVDCVSLRQLGSSTIIDGNAIAYDAFGTIFVNRPRSGADALEDDNDTILVTTSPINQLCKLDSVRLVSRSTGVYKGFVTLDAFVPYTHPPR
jgi:hypothetical protein